MPFVSEDYMIKDTPTVGSLNMNRQKNENDRIKEILTTTESSLNISPITNIGDILKSEHKSNIYTKKLMENYTRLADTNPYYAEHASKLNQLINNSNYELKKENALAPLAPVVGLTAPTLVKTYETSVVKDIVQTDVSTQAIVRKSFERVFLRDRDGNKYYVPDVFYNSKWKEVIDSGKGKKIKDEWYPTTGELCEVGLSDFDILGESGGSVQKRDSLSTNFHIQAIKIKVKDQTGSGEEEIEMPINLLGRLHDNHVSTQQIIAYGKDTAKTPQKADIVLKVDWEMGKVSVLVSKQSKITKVKFGGNLSNQNNNEVIEYDKERKNFEWNMKEGISINTGIGTEKIQDISAHFNIDFVVDAVNNLTKISSAFEDKDVLNQINEEYHKWSNENIKDFPLGYEDGFVLTKTFTTVPSNTNNLLTTPQYLTSEFQFTLTKMLAILRGKLKEDSEVAFVVFAHPDNIDLIMAGIEWIIGPDKGLTTGNPSSYRVGITTNTGATVRVVSSYMIPYEDQVRIVAHTSGVNVFTFLLWKYSFNIENIYRNPLTPNNPNLRMFSRYSLGTLLPVQGKMTLTGERFGRGAVE